MSTAVAGPPLSRRARRLVLRARAPRVSWTAVAVAVIALYAAALALRSRALGAPLWMDEGMSVGIASHSLSAIPHLLRLDGSPPLYYVVLHLWMGAFGSGERAMHALSALFAVLSVPAAFWAGWRLFGRWSGVAAAALAALSPLLGLYADETRMYALLFLLATLAAGAFAQAFIHRRRAWAPGFGVLLATVVYTHNWGAFFAVSAGLAFLATIPFAERRQALLIDGAIGFGVALVLVAPWLPTMIFQSHHTGAPWSHVPHWHSLTNAVRRMLGGRQPELLLLLVAALGVVIGLVRGPSERRRAFVATFVLAAGTLMGAWLYSRMRTPAWATRYLTLVAAPLFLLLAGALLRAGPLGIAAIAVSFLGFWAGHPSQRTLEAKSNVREVATLLAPRLRPGALVLSPQPEQVPVLHYYLPPGLRYVTPLGMSADPRVMDWRDAMARYRSARYARVLHPLIRDMRAGQQLLLVQPLFHHPDAQWTRAIRRTARRWHRALKREPGLRRAGRVLPLHGSSRSTVAAYLYMKVPAGRQA